MPIVATTHTPGPWRVSALDRTVIGAVRVLSVPAMEAHVPQLQAVARLMERMDETEANARLIAAAPEMYAALKHTLDYWDSCGFSDCAEGCDCIVQSVQAAIAKAEGR